MLEQPRDRPCRRRGPRIGQWIEERVGELHRLAVAVSLTVLAPHPVRQTRVPRRAPRVGAGQDDVVSRAERRQVDFHTRINGPPDLVLLVVAARKAGEAAPPRSQVGVEDCAIGAGADIDVMDHARNLGLAPALLDMQGPDDVRPFLAAVLDQRRIERPCLRPRIGIEIPAVLLGAAAGGADSCRGFPPTMSP